MPVPSLEPVYPVMMNKELSSSGRSGVTVMKANNNAQYVKNQKAENANHGWKEAAVVCRGDKLCLQQRQKKAEGSCTHVQRCILFN